MSGKRGVSASVRQAGEQAREVPAIDLSSP
jgi:hypothetical protein